MTSDTPPAGPERPAQQRAGLVAGCVVIALAVAMTIFFLLPDDPGPRDLVSDVVGLHGRPATADPPGATSATLLAVEVDGVPFPSFIGRFGWTATGTREDVVNNRRAVTVFYERAGARLGYTVLSGRALAPLQDARRVRVAGTRLRTTEIDGRDLVVWVRRGHTCVMSAVDVRPAELNRLAAWKGQGTIPF
jgi:hypothetical protein